VNTPTSSPNLTVAVPTFERPVLLARALTSVVSQRDVDPSCVEILVSDNAPGVAEPIVRRLLDRWSGPTRYLENRPSLGPIGNFNHCLESARGDYVLILHDDDYLLPGALGAILASADRWKDEALLFSVDVVDERGRVRRRQRFHASEYLPPARAVRRLLTDSSFVRMPAVVFRREIFTSVGGFDPAFGNPTDFELLLRVFGRYGVRVEPAVTSAYTVHVAAATSEMFDEANARIVLEVFARARASGLLPEAAIRRSEVAWFHQWILGGSYRRLRVGDVPGARGIMALFDLPEIDSLGRSARWAPVRALFGVLVRLPGGLAGRVMRLVGSVSPERLWSG
jgi:glycosyltransferase involved in cell wall biosynthesis